MNVTLPIHQHALRMPGKPAIVTPEQTLNYGELDEVIWRATSHIAAHGLRPGDIVGLAVQQPLLHLVTALALSRLGIAYHTIAPEEGAGIVNGVQKDFGASAVVTGTALPGVETLQIAISSDLIRAASPRGPDGFADNPDGLWRFAKSSGTTGRPKLFALTYPNLTTMMARYRMGVPLCASDVSMVVVHISFLSATRRVLQDLIAGATVVLLDPQHVDQVAKAVATAGVSRLYAGPWLLPHFLARRDLDPTFRRISVLESSGSMISMDLRRAVLERYTGGLVVNYGTNELHSISTAIGTACLAAPETVGWPVARGAVQIVDETDAPVSPGVIGRIRVRDTDMIAGYWNDEAATRAAFQDGWFYPGDLAAWSERGEILFKGRADDMIIFDGINIFPAEIENCLLQHPAVTEVVAFSLPHRVHGDVPVAAVRVCTDIDTEVLEHFCRERLGIRHPRKIIMVSDLPRNAGGKADKRELAKMVRFADA
jgi:cyanophycin synthetase